MERATASSTRNAAIQAETMAAAFELTAAANADRVALRTRGGERELTWGEYADQVDSVALGLRELGLERGQSLAIMLTNRPEFHVADSAAMSLGATPFSLYQTLAPDQIAYQLSDSGTRIIVTEPAFLDHVMAALPNAPDVEHVVLVEAGGGAKGVVSFDDLLSSDGDRGAIAEARRAVEPEDLLTLIYTSGTTGPPKGVQITHGNIMSAVEAFEEAVGFPKGARVVSYLPMAHIAERVTGHYLPLALGHTVTCCPNPREVSAYLPEVRPTWFFAVPRIWEKLKAGIEAMIEGEPDEQRKGALKRALEVGHRKVRFREGGEAAPGRSGAGLRGGRRAGPLEGARTARPGRSRERVRRRGADADGGVRVLPRDRDPAGGALGPLRELWLRRGEPSRQDQAWHRRPGHARNGARRSPRTARCSCAGR